MRSHAWSIAGAKRHYFASPPSLQTLFLEPVAESHFPPTNSLNLTGRGIREPQTFVLWPEGISFTHEIPIAYKGNSLLWQRGRESLFPLFPELAVIGALKPRSQPEVGAGLRAGGPGRRPPPSWLSGWFGRAALSGASPVVPPQPASPACSRLVPLGGSSGPAPISRSELSGRIAWWTLPML